MLVCCCMAQLARSGQVRLAKDDEVSTRAAEALAKAANHRTVGFGVRPRVDSCAGGQTYSHSSSLLNAILCPQPFGFGRPSNCDYKRLRPL